MRFEGARRSAQAPNLTPLIDIVFLLLVFFLLTAHFVRDEGVIIQLPQAESATIIREDSVIEVLLDREGKLHLNGQETVFASLEEAIREALQKRDKKWVTLRADQGANLGVAINILDAARKAGADNVDIVTENPS